MEGPPALTSYIPTLVAQGSASHSVGSSKTAAQRSQVTPLALLISQPPSLETITTRQAVSQADAQHPSTWLLLQTTRSPLSHASFLSTEQTLSKDLGATESGVKRDSSQKTA